jgi:hypothetical protein
VSDQRPSAIGKTARNEQIKLRAATLNALGLGFGVVGVVQPIVAGAFTPEAVAKLAITALIAYLFHNRARRDLGALED